MPFRLAALARVAARQIRPHIAHTRTFNIDDVSSPFADGGTLYVAKKSNMKRRKTMAKSDPVINVVTADIWKTGGPDGTGYGLELTFMGGGGIMLFEAKYKKDVVARLRLYRRLVKSISIEEQFKILKSIHDHAKTISL